MKFCVCPTCGNRTGVDSHGETVRLHFESLGERSHVKVDSHQIFGDIIVMPISRLYDVYINLISDNTTNKPFILKFEPRINEVSIPIITRIIVNEPMRTFHESMQCRISLKAGDQFKIFCSDKLTKYSVMLESCNETI